MDHAVAVSTTRMFGFAIGRERLMFGHRLLVVRAESP
jgi:hypothetical protein